MVIPYHTYMVTPYHTYIYMGRDRVNIYMGRDGVKSVRVIYIVSCDVFSYLDLQYFYNTRIGCRTLIISICEYASTPYMGLAYFLKWLTKIV